MSASVFFPARDICNEHSRAHDVLESRAQAMQHTLDVLQTLNGLGVSITDADNLTVITKCRSSGNVDASPDTDGAGITDNRFPFCARGYLLTFSLDHA